MRLLLDSHAFLWFCEGSSNLSTPARNAIEDPVNEKWVSHVTAWEVAIKAGIGKLKLQIPYEPCFRERFTRTASAR
jgi:PIN domain nuclease of toxin-antitoxin system